MDLLLVAARLFFAAFLGALIGLEREIKKRAAGFRTHIIVSVGSCLVMLISVYGFGNIYGDRSWDPTRFGSQVISGIGFLGAGTILQKHDAVTGLTTAATLWLSAAIGLAVGVGYYEGAIIATIICLLILVPAKNLADHINNKDKKSYYLIFNTNHFDQMDFLDYCLEEDIEVVGLNIIDEGLGGTSIIESNLSFDKNYNINKFFKRLKKDFDLKSYKIND